MSRPLVKSADIETRALVTISEFLSPIYFPKKPEIIEAISGRNKIEISIINLSNYLFLRPGWFLNFDSILQ